MIMRLRVLLPTRVLVEAGVQKITAEGQHGSFTLLPLLRVGDSEFLKIRWQGAGVRS